MERVVLGVTAPIQETPQQRSQITVYILAFDLDEQAVCVWKNVRLLLIYTKDCPIQFIRNHILVITYYETLQVLTREYQVDPHKGFL